MLQTGSTIVGTADGGPGNNVVTLQGTGTAANAFTNFQTLVMQGTAWTWAGSGTFTSALLQSGTLTLTGTLGTSPAVSISSGAALDMAGVSQTFGNVNNAGTILTHGAGPGTTLTVANYVGAGGNIVFNTFLGADDSPSDRLVIDGGTATGTTTLTIHNTNGPGAPTMGDGILVVNAINGATTAPAHSLSQASCAPACSTIVCSRAASPAAIPITGSCARPSWCRPPRPSADLFAGIWADTVERASGGPAARDAAAGPLSDPRAGARHIRRGAADRAADGAADPRHAA